MPKSGSSYRRIELAYRHLGLLLQALAAVVVFRVALTLRPYRQLAHYIRVHPSGQPDRLNPRLAAWAVQKAAKVVPAASCLPQALALQYLLARNGIAAVIRIGVEKGRAGGFNAHAWVLHREEIILGGTSERLEQFSILTDLAPR